jgi:predicted  nucleic acid-binding Zn-ribbon protein
MGLFSIFVDVKKDQPQSEPNPQSKVAATIQPIMQVAVQQPQAQVDNKIAEQLTAALEQANLPGFDYFEYTQAVDSQKDLIPAEQARYQSVFRMAATTMKLTVDSLLKSAQHYLDVLKGKENEFLSAVESHVSTEIVGKEKNITDIDAQMQQKTEQIKKLTEEMNQIQQQKTVLQNEIAAGKAEVEKVKINFNATMQVLVNKITMDVQKIQQYLGGQ